MEENDSVTAETLIDDESRFMDFDLLDTSNPREIYTYHPNLSDDSTSYHFTSIASSRTSKPPNQTNSIDSMAHFKKCKKDHTNYPGSSIFIERNVTTR